MITANSLGPTLPGQSVRPAFHFMGMSPSSQKLSIPARYDGAASVMCFTERWPIKVCHQCGEEAPEMIDNHLFADCDVVGDKGGFVLMVGWLLTCVLMCVLIGKRVLCDFCFLRFKVSFAISHIAISVRRHPCSTYSTGIQVCEGALRHPFCMAIEPA